MTPSRWRKDFNTIGIIPSSRKYSNGTYNDLNRLKSSKNPLLVLPAGKSAHIESGIAYGMDKKCYAIGEYDATDSLYNIFENIVADEKELEEFLKTYKVLDN